MTNKHQSDQPAEAPSANFFNNPAQTTANQPSSSPSNQNSMPTTDINQLPNQSASHQPPAFEQIPQTEKQNPTPATTSPTNQASYNHPIQNLAAPKEENKITPVSAPLAPPLSNKTKRRLLIAALGGLFFIGIALIASLLFAKPKLILTNLSDQSRVLIDGQKIDQSAIALVPGKHFLKISRAGYIPLEKKFSINYFQRKRQNAALRPLPQARQIVSQEAFSLSQDSQNTIYYLDKSAHIIYELKFDANRQQTIKTALTPSLNFDLDQVIFSPDFSLAVFKLKNGETGLYDFKRYDLLHQEYHPWGKNIGDLVWNQDGTKILYFQTLESGKKALTLADKNNTQQQYLIFLDEYEIKDVSKIDWTNDGKIALFIAGEDLYLFDIEARTAPSLVTSGQVSEAKFSPDNQKILFTQNHQLKIVTFQSSTALGKKLADLGKFTIQPIKDLNIDASANKAIFTPDSQKIIAFSPTKKLVEINLISQKTTPFNYQKQDKLQIDSLQLARDQKTLFFLTQDKKLMSLKLDKGNY